MPCKVLLHTSGSVSHASTRHKLGEELGRPARRDEVFVKTHTRKNGVPSRQAAPKIDEIKEILEVYLEVVDRTIQQGDAYAIVCGLKEPKGCVRVLGVGPTPQDIGTSELKSYMPTRIQIEVLAREKAESEKAALQQRVKELEEQMLEERLAQERQNHESNSQHGSNSRHQVSPRPEEAADESHQNNSRAEGGNCTDNEDYDLSDGENLLNQRHATAPLVPAMNNASQPSVHDGHRYAHDSLVGKTVILYAMLRSQAVARGVVISTNPNTILEGQPLGKQFCEVIVNLVLKRDAMLPRPYDDMETMADADMMSIAWPYKRLKVCDDRASKPSHGAVGLQESQGAAN